MQRKWLGILAAILLCASHAVAADKPVTLSEQEGNVALSNGIVSFTVNKANGGISLMTLRGSPNLAGKGAYFAVVNSAGKDGGGDIKNAVYKVVRNTPDLAEISMDAPCGNVHFDQHYVLRKGDQGFYVFVIMRHVASEPPENSGQIRWSYYLNEKLFDYQWATDKENGIVPDMTGSEKVQDATYRLKDGSVYTKYNYCSYIEEDDVHGFCGSKRGSYGAFVVMPSKEYLQAPTKQEITVHAGPIIHRFLVSGHFEPRDLASQGEKGNWTKVCGPWMVYLNTGDTPREMWTDAKAQFKKEEAQWPYKWMENKDYPLQRGEVTGALKLYDGKHPAANALMVLAAPEPNWQVQTNGYIFRVRADAEGKFDLKHVRPGTYTLYAVIPGVTDEFRKDNLLVKAGEALELGMLDFTPAYYSARVFQIGTATWKSVGFKLSDELRQYGLGEKVPADLTYTVGKSTPEKDWYFAQAKPGAWDIVFTLDKAVKGEGILTLGIAGQTNNPHLDVKVNGKGVGTYTGGNSSALYRSAILGGSFHETKVIKFPAADMTAGENKITLNLLKGGIHYDVVKLELDEPGVPRKIPE